MGTRFSGGWDGADTLARAGDGLRRRRDRRSPRRRAHRRARWRRALAALALGAAVWLIVSALRPAAPDPGVAVLVAGVDAPAGSVLEPSEVRIVHRPEESLSDGSLRDPQALPSRPLAAPIRAGEVLTDVRFVGADALDAAAPDTVLTHAPVVDLAVLSAVQPGRTVHVVSTLDGSVVAAGAVVSSVDDTGAFLLLPQEDAAAVAVAAAGGVPGAGVTLVVLPD